MASSSGSCAHCRSACRRPPLTAAGRGAAAAGADALACERCLSVAYCSAACKAAHQPQHGPRECRTLAARASCQLEDALLAVEGVNLPGWALALTEQPQPPTPAQLQRLQRMTTLMRTVFGSEPSKWPVMLMMALAMQVRLALDASTSSATAERHGVQPAFVVPVGGADAPVEMYQSRHAAQKAARLQREIGPILAELQHAVAQAPLRTKREDGDDYARVVKALVQGLGAVGEPLEAVRLLRREAPVLERVVMRPGSASCILLAACGNLADATQHNSLEVRSCVCTCMIWLVLRWNANHPTLIAQPFHTQTHT